VWWTQRSIYLANISYLYSEFICVAGPPRDRWSSHGARRRPILAHSPAAAAAAAAAALAAPTDSAAAPAAHAAALAALAAIATLAAASALATAALLVGGAGV